MIKGWFNVLTKTTHAVDDYVGMANVMPAPLLRIIKRLDDEDVDHVGTRLTVTSGIGCPRRTLIERLLPTTPDPVRLMAATLGTGWHGLLASEMKGMDGWTVEANGGRDECRVKGQLLGHAMTGRMDARHEHGGQVDEVWDYKFSMSGADQFTDGLKAKGEHAAQLNMLRLLMIQQGMRVSPGVKMTAWVIGKTAVPTVARTMDELSIGLTPILNSSFTVREGTDEVAEAFAMVDRLPQLSSGGPPLEDVREVIKAMPMRGLDMLRNDKKGTSLCDYCAFKHDCEELAGRTIDHIRLERTGKVVEIEKVRRVEL